MKKLLLPAILLLGCAADGYGYLSLPDQALLRRQRMEQRGAVNSRGPRKAAPQANAEHVSLAMIKIADGYDRADLEAEGVTVSSVRGAIALVSLPTSDVERVAALPCVHTLELARELRTNMDQARAFSTVQQIHEGAELDHAYTGAGVLTAVVDGGVDPNHINFRNDDGSSRIGYLVHSYIDNKSSDGWTGERYDRDNIWRFTTDTEETFHGTHTLGILAGGYRGKIDAAVVQNTQLSTIETIDNPYYGVATEADMAVGCGDLVDRLIAENIDQILNYRYATGAPCVLSLSLGSNTGSHSPESLMAQFLDEVSKEAIVVLSAGNEGDVPLALIKTLSEDETEAKTFVLPTYQSNLRYGQVYFYSDKPFSMQGVIYNKERERVSYRMAVGEAQGQGEPVYHCSSDFYESSTDVVSTQFSNAFSGYVGVGWDVDTYSGQYMCLMDYYTVDNASKNAKGNYILGFIVTGEPGQRIECYCDGIYTCLDDYDQDGWDNGMTDGTISDMACGYNSIVVGAYNTREVYGGMDGYAYHYNGAFTPGKMTPFSSYGTLADGRTLPHVCAPGASIISSTSSYYTENPENYVTGAALSARLDEDDRSNYWCPAAGTSMATPFVAGAIALWLEADPTLTAEDVKGIIARTSLRDEEVERGNPVQWGAGKFDAYAGLKEVLRMAGVTSASAESSDLMVSHQGAVWNVFLAGAKSMEVSVCNLSGATVLRKSVAGDELSFDTSALSKGVYVLTVNGSHSRKIAVK